MQLPPDIGIRSLRVREVAGDTSIELLSAAERGRYGLICHPKVRRHFLAGRVALRLLLADHMGFRPSEVPLATAADGGVDLTNTSMRVGIAHSGDWAVAVAAPHTVGVDLERIQPRSPDVVNFMVHASERNAYEALPLDPVRRLILYWTLKESVLKAIRTGFRRSPKKVRLSICLEDHAGLAFMEDRSPLALRFQERGGYYVAVAFEP